MLPTLRKLGVKHLDLMLISHGHADHAGGAATIGRGLPLGRVLAGSLNNYRRLCGHAGASVASAGTGMGWTSCFGSGQGPAGNERSCALLVQAQGERLLLAGDMEAGAERAWLAATDAPRIDWLQAPHHGSRSSSTEPFIRATSPRGVMISRGATTASVIRIRRSWSVTGGTG